MLSQSLSKRRLLLIVQSLGIISALVLLLPLSSSCAAIKNGAKSDLDEKVISLFRPIENDLDRTREEGTKSSQLIVSKTSRLTAEVQRSQEPLSPLSRTVRSPPTSRPESRDQTQPESRKDRKRAPNQNLQHQPQHQQQQKQMQQQQQQLSPQARPQFGSQQSGHQDSNGRHIDKQAAVNLLLAELASLDLGKAHHEQQLALRMQNGQSNGDSFVPLRGQLGPMGLHSVQGNNFSRGPNSNNNRRIPCFFNAITCF